MTPPEADTPARAAEFTRLLRLDQRREAAVTQIAVWVADGIVSSRLAPGQDLNSVDLAARFNTSRTPVREALMLLESEGLVDVQARKRPRVASFTADQVREVYFLRAHLLALVGELAAQRITPEQASALQDLLAIMREHVAAHDTDAYFWTHVDLQRTFIEIAGNATLAMVLDTLSLRMLVFRHMSLQDDDRLRASLQAQEAIVAAMSEKDSELTSLLLVRNTNSALEAILRVLEKRTTDKASS
ncbi:GntR family transcriptional regulator [Microbacterium album]|uniref:Transcriptional regulator n=1 Tax=Microbacterium album TaxID=2053191 RepID=A0A917IFI1_9MICO|nr:GntR family transcriptional regulator [Microbacterium album]GGH48379.1 transcriptional regulator [Microbacterium album]